MNAKHFLDANNLLYSIGRDPGKTRRRHIAIELLDAALEIRAARRLAYRDRAIAAATGALGCGEFFPRNLAMADGLTASPSSIGFADRNVVELRRPSALATPSRMPHKSPPFVKIYYQSTNFLKDGNA